MMRRNFLIGAAALTACARPRVNAIPAARAESAHPPLGHLIDVEGLSVHATDEGTGGPPVVLIHGANVNLRDWTYAASDALSRTNRVIAMDRPGFGYSARGAGIWTPARQAGQLRAAAAKMGAERPIVVGHSWGAMVALAWALDAPDEVAGVVSVSGATMPWGIGVDVLNFLGVGEIGSDYYTSFLSRRAEKGAIEDFVVRAFRPQRVPAGYIDYVGAPLSLRAGTLRANRDDLAQIQTALNQHSERYGELRVPVEIVHGEIDWLLKIDQHAHGLAKQVRHANVTVAPGVGHMAHHARPDLLAAAIARLGAVTA